MRGPRSARCTLDTRTRSFSILTSSTKHAVPCTTTSSMADMTRRVPVSLREASGLRWHFLFLWIQHRWLVKFLLWLWIAIMPHTILRGLWRRRNWLISLLIPLIGVRRIWHWWRLPLIQIADKKPYCHRQHHNEEQCA